MWWGVGRIAEARREVAADISTERDGMEEARGVAGEESKGRGKAAAP